MSDNTSVMFAMYSIYIPAKQLIPVEITILFEEIVSVSSGS